MNQIYDSRPLARYEIASGATSPAAAWWPLTAPERPFLPAIPPDSV